MRKEWPFEMYSQWSSAMMPALQVPSDLGCPPSQRAHRLISWRGNGCRKIPSDTAGCKISPDCVERRRRCLHHVVSRTAMNVAIDIGRKQRGRRKAIGCPDAFLVACRKILDTTDATVLYCYQRILHYSAWTQKASRRN